MNKLREFDQTYSSWLGIFNPYNTFPYRLDPKIPKFDLVAYKKNPRYRFVYDKLYVTQSQQLDGGTLDELRNKTVTYPIFIKPRWGHKTSSSKNCYKIKSRAELEQHFDTPDMMWSTFIDDKEQMTDFILVNGDIVYQLTYEYSEKQHGFADMWKYISSDNVPPADVVEWVQRNMIGYTGPCNVQYRGTYIIEVGLRFARSGMYIESTGNKQLIDAINIMWKTKSWANREVITIKPFYSFKCWSPIPAIVLMPQHLLDVIMKWNGALSFYEYYFEPTGNYSLVFLQFLHFDFDTGMKIKLLIERLMILFNSLFLIIVALGIICVLTKHKCSAIKILIMVIILFSMDNSINVVISQLTHQKQFIGLN